MKFDEVVKPGSGYPDNWPAAVAKVVELGSATWGSLIRVSVILAVLGFVAWFVTSGMTPP
jgi:hypothetical protein